MQVKNKWQGGCILCSPYFEQNGSRNEKGATGESCNPLILLVGTKGFEPLTPTVSG